MAFYFYAGSDVIIQQKTGHVFSPELQIKKGYLLTPIPPFTFLFLLRIETSTLFNDNFLKR